MSGAAAGGGDWSNQSDQSDECDQSDQYPIKPIWSMWVDPIKSIWSIWPIWWMWADPIKPIWPIWAIWSDWPMWAYSIKSIWFVSRTDQNWSNQCDQCEQNWSTPNQFDQCNWETIQKLANNPNPPFPLSPILPDKVKNKEWNLLFFLEKYFCTTLKKKYILGTTCHICHTTRCVGSIKHITAAETVR